ncbi:survival motor neuron-like protein 1 [Colletotrichum truncatum]|uniref:Survival motor neuron-like protein 1 n=1 Tax=Colletotrichum truncatum TaxID=5467 RepID=A0ACC3Z9Y3_COLTU
MAGKNVELSHAEMWDDSALIDSWNEALDEYKKYHSIHAKGGKLEDVDLQEKSGSQAIDPETEAVDRSEIMVDGEAANETKEVGGSTDVKQPIHPRVQSTASVPAAKAISSSGGAPGPATMGPQGLLGSVQDEGLKRLLMSWYYAGYYTGLYEGQQQTQEPRQ